MQILNWDTTKSQSRLVTAILCWAIVFLAMKSDAQCVSSTANGFQENLLQATFHSALYKTSDGYAASGSSTAPDGSSQPNIQVLSNANGYTGIPASTTITWGTIGGNAQIILLGDDGVIYAGGDEEVVLATSLTTGSAYGPTSLGLPSGVSIGDIQKFQATNEALMIQTDVGEIYITGNACDNVSTPCLNSTWSQVSLPSGITAQIVDLSAKTLFMYGSDGNFYTRGKRIFNGNGASSIDNTGSWILMTSPVLSAGSSPVQIELANHEHYNQIGYLILDADGSIHSLGDAPIVANNSNASFSWTKVGQNCPGGELNNVVFLSASDNDNRHVGAGALLADSTIMLWGVDDFNMLAGAGSECPEVVCHENGSEMTAILYLENGTHLTPAITESGLLCNVGHNSEGGFGDGTTNNRSCYECYSVPSLPDLCIDGSCSQETTIVASICAGTTYYEQSSAYTETGTYVDIYQTGGGCDSIVTTQLTVIPGEGATNEISICQGESYFEGSSEYASSGTYQDSYSTLSGCDSVVTTILSVQTQFETTNEISICQGQSYFEGSSEYSLDGTYEDTYSSSGGCDSVVTTILNVQSEFNTINEVAICDGQSYFEGSSEYSLSGTYEDTYSNSGGCDSVVTTILNVQSEFNTINEVAICDGQSYFEGSSEYSLDGTYEDTYSSSGGCDSVVTTILSVQTHFDTTNEVAICEGESYLEGSSEYTTVGTYQDTYVSSGGCDSVVTTILSINLLTAQTNEVSICLGQSYIEGSSEYSESGVYTDTYQSSLGCDSVITTVLVVNTELNTLNEVSICEGATYNEQSSEYTLSGTYLDTYSAQGGCDSVVTTVLSVVPSSIQTNSISICEGEVYEEQGNAYTESGLYTDVYETVSGCDSTVVTELLVHPLPFMELAFDSVSSCEPIAVDFENLVSNDGSNSYVWDFGDGETSSETTVSHIYENVGIYYATLTLSNGSCQKISETPIVIQISEPPIASFSASPWITDLSAPEVQFFDESIGEIVTNEWDFGDGNVGFGASVSNLYVDEGEYIVTLAIEAEGGCTDTISNLVIIESDEIEIVIPNAFIPNASGPGNGIFDPASFSNEIFFPYSEEAEGMELYIFDRWGEQLFKSKDIEKGWDGYFQGRPCPQGVYSYRVVFTYPTGEEIQKLGSVTLFR